MRYVCPFLSYPELLSCLSVQMASRLLSRYSHLLCRASSQAPAAAAAAATARLPPPVAGLAEVQRAQGWPWATERLMSDGKTVPKHDRFPTTRDKLHELVNMATMPKDVILAWNEHGGDANQAAIALIQWTKLKVKSKENINHRELLHDTRLVHMMDTINKGVATLRGGVLVSLMHTFWVINMPPSNNVLRAVQTEVLWQTRRLPYKQLLYLFSQVAGRKNQLDTQIFDAAMKQLELRVSEITDAKTVSRLISRGDQLSPAFMAKLEDKALELAEGFTADDIRKVCLSLATQNRRSVSLLRVLSYYLLQKPSSQFTTPVMMNIAFAYGKLNFQHSHVFQRIASELFPRVPQLTSSDVTGCAKSFGFLKWLHVPLFGAFALHYEENSQDYSIDQVCNLLMTFARLNFQPSNRDAFFSKVHSALEDSFSGLEPFLQTDVAWSFCALQQAKPQYLIPLMQEKHVTNLSKGNPVQVESYQLKLLHIEATLQLEHPGSSNTPSSLSALFAPPASSTISPLQSNLRETLRSLVGERTEALRTGVNTVYGWTFDGELVVDYDNNPIDLSELKAPHLPSGGGDQDLPTGAHRLAFIAWDYPNFGSKTRELLGRFVMMKRHLQLAGFAPVEVPYYEWLELKTDSQKLAYLKDRMGKAVAEEASRNP